MKILIILTIIIGLLNSDGIDPEIKEQEEKKQICCTFKSNTELNTYKIDTSILKIKSIEKESNELVKSNAELKTELINLKNDNEKLFESYKELLNNSHTLYSNFIGSFELVLIIISIAVSILSIIGWKEIQAKINNSIKETIDLKATEAIVDLEDLRTSLAIKTKEYEDVLSAYKKELEELGQKSPDNFTEEDRTKIDTINKDLLTKNNKSADEWVIVGLHHHNNGDNIEAIKAYEEALKIEPNLDIAFSNWGSSLIGLARTKINSDDRKRVLEESIEKSKKSIMINPNLEASYSNLAGALIEIGIIETDNEQKKKLFLEAVDNCKEAIKRNNNSITAYNNWASALLNLSYLENNVDDKKRLIEESIKKCREATSIDKNIEIPHINLGSSYCSLSELESDSNTKKSLCKEAIEEYKKAIEINPLSDMAYGNMANTFTSLSKLASGDEKDRLCREAIRYYEKSIAINPNNSVVKKNLSISKKICSGFYEVIET